MNRVKLTLAALFITVLANANDYLTPIMRPDTGYEGTNYLNMAVAALIFIGLGVYLVGLDKRLKNELKNKN